MATDTHTGGIRPVTLPNQFPPMPAVSRVMAQFDRSQVEAFVEVAIAFMDLFDGDADLEPESDRGVDDDGEQATWPTNLSQASNGANCMAWDNDDAEDDDPDHEHDGREMEEDRCLAGDDGCGPFVRHGFVHWGSALESGDV